MKTIASLLSMLLYVAGLILLWTNAHVIWMIFGIFLPIIPFVYAVYEGLVKLGMV